MDSISTKGTLKTVKVTFMWDITNFCMTCYKTSQAIQSPVFTVNQEKWCIKLYPKGELEDCKGFISIFLFSCSSKKIEAKFSISILDLENKKYYTAESLKEFDTLGYGMKHFIKHSEVVKNKHRILPEDTLRILCEITTDRTFDNEDNTSNSRGIKRPHSDIDFEITNNKKQSFRVLFDNQMFSDVKIICTSNKFIYAHKAVLISQNEVFQAMLMNHSSDNQNTIEMKDIDYEVLKEMIYYVYTGEVNDIHEHALKLLAPAQKYLLTDLTLLCEKSLCDNLSATNALGYFDAANRYRLIDLKKKAADYIVLNMKDILKVPEFESITTLHPSIIVDVCKYSASEGE